MEYKFTREEYDKIDQYLLYELGVQGVLSESACRRIHSTAKILNESVEHDYPAGILMEASKEPLPIAISYDAGQKHFTVKHGFKYTNDDGSTNKDEKTTTVSPETVKREWFNTANTNALQFLLAVGLPNDLLSWYEDMGKLSLLTNKRDRFFDLYNKRYAPMHEDVDVLPPFSERNNTVNVSVDRVKAATAEPSQEDINRKGTRKSTYVDRINRQEIADGEFYRDVTRISKTRTRGWLRNWKNSLKRVSTQKKSLLGRFIGRTWKKSFLLGYQSNRTIFYEVWYNSMDSSFSVHDRNGVEVTHPVPTLQEAISLLIRTVAQNAPNDSGAFSSSSAGQEMANSLRRALEISTQSDIEKIAKEDELRNRELARERNEEELNARENSQRNSQSADSQRRQDERDRARRQREANRQQRGFGQRDYSGGTPEGQRERIRQSINNAKKKTKDAVSAIPSAVLDEYRFAMVYSRRRISEILEKLKEVKENPEEIGRIDPKLKKAFKERLESTLGAAGKTNLEDFDPRDIESVAKDLTTEYTSRAMAIDAALASKEDRNFADSVENYIDTYGEAAVADPYVGAYSDPSEFNSTKTPKKKSVLGSNPVRKGSTKGASTFINYKRKNNGDNITENLDDLGAGLRHYNDETRTAKNQYDARTKEELDDVERKREERRMKKEMEQEGDRQREKVRDLAKNSSYTRQLLIQDINNSIYTYDVTKMRQSAIKGIIAGWIGNLRRGRSAPIQNPLKGQSWFNRLQQALYGDGYRADFVLGYSMNDIINVEIWYITEEDPSTGNFISSFYVYDVEAQKIIRSHLPYLRNANQVIAAKLGVQ